MFSYVYLRLNTNQWIKRFTRFQSTKVTFARKMCPQEFCFESYDCVGFDLDHTLSRYKLKPLFTLIYKTLASFLIKKYNYPDHLSDLSDSDLSFAQKGIVLDKKRGNFLKLDGEYRIIKASHGMRLMSSQDVTKIYGPNRVWEESKGIPSKLVLTHALDEPFYVFKDYFVTAGAVICAKMIDIVDQRAGKEVGEYSFWSQYIDGIYYMYDRSNFKNESGEFFPELKSNPELYLRPASENVKKWLENMCRNKVTFLLTSSNYDSAEFIAEYCLGKDWRNYFDIIVTFARKPGFFWKDKPFFLVENNSEVGSLVPGAMKSNSIYSQGNFKGLREICSTLSKSENPKTVYFGDSLIEDVYAASEIGGCDTVAIVEEMLAEGMENISEQHAESKALTSEFWGSFFSNAVSTNPEENATFWARILSQHSKLTIPNLDSICRLPLQEKVSSFGNEMLTTGYFPSVPKTLSSA